MRSSLKLGRIAGIEIELHWTFLLLLAWVALASYQRAGGPAAGASVLFLLAVFGSVVLHELGHALVARRYGVRTQGITLLPIGGVARLERIPEKPSQELVIAAAGPAVTIALVAGLYAVLRASGTSVAPPQDAGNAVPMLAQLMWINVALALFNLLPAFPMDGGRILRAALAMRMDRARATDIAARIGKGFAIVFGLVGLFVTNNLLLVVIALFVWIGAATEAMAARIHVAVEGVPVSRIMATEIRTLAPEQPIAAAVEEVRAGFQDDFPVMSDHTVVGVLTRQSLLQALGQGRTDAAVADVMQRDFATVQADDPVDDALRSFENCRCRTLPVLRGRDLVGLLTLEKVGEFVSLQRLAATNSTK